MNKKNIFITLGIALIGAFVVIGRNSSIYAAVKEGARFEDWIVVCEKHEKNEGKTSKLCYLSQALTKDEKKVAEFKIGYFGPEKNLQMIQILPLGVNVGAGSALVVDKEIIAPGKFLACYSYGCLALVDLKDTDLKRLYGKEETFIGVVIADANKQVNFKFSTKGLKKGIEAIK
jgi:invasion protein IalB